jgi:hypothetical protein
MNQHGGRNSRCSIFGFFDELFYLFKVKKFYFPAIFLFILTSCTKNSLDNQGEVGFADKKFTNQFVRLGTSPVTVNLKIKLDDGKMMNKDCRIDIQVSAQSLTAYNLSSGTNYKLLPDSCYSVPGLSATIVKGKSETSLPVIFYPSKINAYEKYILPFQLAGASQGDINPASNQLLLRVMLANDYTGLYTDTITCRTPNCFPTFPCINYIDTVITKSVTAISADSCIMDVGVPGLNSGIAFLRIKPNNSVDILGDMSLGGILNGFAQGYYIPSSLYFNLPYCYITGNYILPYNYTGSYYLVLLERLRKL